MTHRRREMMVRSARGARGMRPWTVALLAGLLIGLPLVGCGSSDDSRGGGSTSAADSTSSDSKGKDFKGSIVLHLRVPAVETFGYGALAAGEELGFDVNVVGPQQFNNLEEQKIAQSEVDAGAQGLSLLLV